MTALLIILALALVCFLALALVKGSNRLRDLNDPYAICQRYPHSGTQGWDVCYSMCPNFHRFLKKDKDERKK